MRICHPPLKALGRLVEPFGREAEAEEHLFRTALDGEALRGDPIRRGTRRSGP